MERALWVLFAVNLFNFYDRAISGALAEPIRREFQLSDAGIGLLSTAFTWLYAIVGCRSGVSRTGGAAENCLPPACSRGAC